MTIESDKIEEPKTFEPLRVAAELLLSRSQNKQIHIHKIERLTEKGRRNLLLRCFIDPVKDIAIRVYLRTLITYYLLLITYEQLNKVVLT